MKLIATLLLATLSWSGSTNIGGFFITNGVPVGTVLQYAGQTLPDDNWMWADGTCISRSTYPALFTQLGTLHRTCGGATFGLPDLRGKFVRGWTTGDTMNISVTGTAGQVLTTASPTGFANGMRVRLVSGTVTGVSANTDYFAVAQPGSGFALATTRANAWAGTYISVSAASSAVFSQWEDPDAGTRAGYSGPNTGVLLGGYQADGFRSHTHTQAGGNVGYWAGFQESHPQYRNTVPSAETQPTGGNETRPSNVALAYIIRVK